MNGVNTGRALDLLLAVIGDRHAGQIDFLLCSGDIAETGATEEYSLARKLFGIDGRHMAPGPLMVRRPGLAGTHLYAIPGNHDDRDRFVCDLFGIGTARTRLHLAFSHKGIRFICPDLGHELAGDLCDETLRFIQGELQRGEPSVFVMHHHPIPVGIPWLDRALPNGLTRLQVTLSAHLVLGLLFGHVHMSVEGMVGDVPALGLGSLAFRFALTDGPKVCSAPLQYRLVTVCEGGLTSRVMEV